MRQLTHTYFDELRHIYYDVERRLLKFNGLYTFDWLATRKLGSTKPASFPHFKIRCKIASKSKLLYGLMWDDWR